MINKDKIKIVKRSERPVAPVAKAAMKTVKTTRQAAREVVSNVSGWVNELRDRKAEETRTAIDLLFNTRRPATDS